MLALDNKAKLKKELAAAVEPNIKNILLNSQRRIQSSRLLMRKEDNKLDLTATGEKAAPGGNDKRRMLADGGDGGDFANRSSTMAPAGAKGGSLLNDLDDDDLLQNQSSEFKVSQ